jgi:hypothetical protein
VPQSQSGRGGKEKKSHRCHFRESNCGRPARSLVSSRFADETQELIDTIPTLCFHFMHFVQRPHNMLPRISSLSVISTALAAALRPVCR